MFVTCCHNSFPVTLLGWYKKNLQDVCKCLAKCNLSLWFLKKGCRYLSSGKILRSQKGTQCEKYEYVRSLSKAYTQQFWTVHLNAKWRAAFKTKYHWVALTAAHYGILTCISRSNICLIERSHTLLKKWITRESWWTIRQRNEISFSV